MKKELKNLALWVVGGAFAGIAVASYHQGSSVPEAIINGFLYLPKVLWAMVKALVAPFFSNP